jgi:glutamine phosphoribosylpyrophosphate amidotransferase
MHWETSIVGVHGASRTGPSLVRALAASRARGPAGVVVMGPGGVHRWTGVADAGAEMVLDSLRGTHGVAQLGPRGRADELPGVVVEPDPVYAETQAGPVAIAMRGGLVGAAEVWERVMAAGALRRTGADAELLLQLVGRADQRTPLNRLVDALWSVRGGFALVAATRDGLVGVRDPRGIVELYLGSAEGGTVLATEPEAIAAIGGELLRPVAPGEMAVVHDGGIDSVHPFPERPVTPCVVQQVRLTGGRGMIGGRTAWAVRRALGAELARQQPAAAGDVVVAAPEDAAIATGAATVWGLSRLPWDDAAFEEEVPGRAVRLVASGGGDGGQVRDAVGRLLIAGASAVHVLLALPLAERACPYGVQFEPESAAGNLGAASVTVLDGVRLHGVLDSDGWCHGCHSGTFPEQPTRDEQLGLFDE